MHQLSVSHSVLYSCPYLFPSELNNPGTRTTSVLSAVPTLKPNQGSVSAGVLTGEEKTDCPEVLEYAIVEGDRVGSKLLWKEGLRKLAIQ